MTCGFNSIDAAMAEGSFVSTPWKADSSSLAVGSTSMPPANGAPLSLKRNHLPELAFLTINTGLQQCIS